jgi:hypothetical protein
VTTIAVQLANNVRTTRRTICDAISAHSHIAHQALREQWRLLVLGPLSMLRGSDSADRYVLVIDALDECEDENDIRTILQVLAEIQSSVDVQLRVFLTSRPEVPIRDSFTDMPDASYLGFVLHNIEPTIVEHDIRIYLEYHLERIAQDCSLITGWPGEQDIQRLAHDSGGLFIWAATAWRFIWDGRPFAARRLETILERTITAITGPEQRLDAIYCTVLRHCISSRYSNEEANEFQSTLKKLLGSLVTLFAPLSARSLSNLLGISQVSVNFLFRDHSWQPISSSSSTSSIIP